MRLDTLTRILDHQGPFASALLDVSRTTEDARQKLDLRGRAARAELVAAGAPQAVADDVVARLLEPTGTPGETARFVVAGREGVLVDETLPRWSGREVLTWGPLPDTTAWLAYQEAAVPVLVVLADHLGADLHHYTAWGREPGTVHTVEGSTENLSKVPDGGWAMADLQRRTDEVWRFNARAVVAELERLAGTEPPLIVLAGDPRARHDVRTGLPPHIAEQVVEAEHGSRADGASNEAFVAEADAAVRRVVDERRRRAAERLEEHLGRQYAVAVGLAEVLDMTVQAGVETVVLDGDRAAGRTVRPADHPYLPLPDGVRSAPAVRSDLLVLAAAAATGAEAVFSAPSLLPDDGVAALLRWDRPAPQG
ncbi:baeRF2 domain-containing protein [Jiangella rhizosphaerae]|uniref:Peptide chain release factor 1 n=1 Tax=Jiangella rhizosphaerae TaxID=2293569 RepID=A0A418KRX8_9ACTN|nr:Vms1/Ankzf1 family peptidyl-tRNA hydrolase [Jiangella rhizosphaerae]RIQ26287.1 hypothetical protein DY240_10560 [Jiangella rhizosphaerae]